jgi:hypothetical protein
VAPAGSEFVSWLLGLRLAEKDGDAVMAQGSIFIINASRSPSWVPGFVVPGNVISIGSLNVGVVEKVEGERVYVRWARLVEIGSYTPK